ncbi:MAG: hypothetical protein EOP06_01550 [Proteobacteria bacterium]|nr:MAG: hypothetical protein EOP06_01550 [Pseudomonadota bacterium]
MRHFTGLLISVLALSSYACSPGTSERKPDSAYLNQIGSQDPLDQLKVILETSSNKEDSKLAMQKYLTAQGYSPSEVNQVIEAFMSSPLKNTDGLTYLEKIAALKVEANTLKGTNVEGVPTLSTILSGVKNLSSASAANGSDFLGGISGFQGSLKSIEQAALKNDLSEVAIRSNAVNEAAKAKDPLTSAFLLNQLANASSLTDISTVAGLAGLMSTSEVLTLEVIQESFKNQALKAVIDELAQDYSKLVSSGYDVGDTSTAGSTAKSFETNISNIIKDPSKAVDIAASARSEYERAILSLDTTPPSAPQQLAVPEQLDSLAVIPLQIVQGSPVNDFKEFSYKVCADSSCAGCSVEEIRTASGSFNFGPAALGRKYKVCARSVDFAGNLSAFMESTDIKIVDLTPPLFELEDGDLPGQNPSRKTKSSIRLSPVALDAKSYSWSIVSLPSGGSATFSSMNSRTTNVTFTADGLYKIKSTATDEAGNKAYLTYDIFFDHTAPVMPTFTAIVTSVPVTLSVTSDDSTATYAYASQNPSQPLSITEISPGVISVDAALDGVYTLVITARDEVLNESTRLVSFTKNSAAPSLTLSVPTHVSAASVASVAISGSCSAAAANPVNVTIETISDSVSCVAGSYSKSFDLSSLSDGSKSISVTQTNSSTNLQASQSQSLVKDTVSPIMSITSIDAINAANKANYPISGTCSENVSVLITVESVQSSTLSCTSGLFSTHLNLSALSDGSKTLTATGTDPSTNVGSASVALTKDVQAPSLNFTVAPSARSSSAAVVAALSSSDGAQSSRSTIVAGDTACLSNMTYSSDTPLASGINLSFLAQGAHTVCILGKDAAGNETSAANALRLVIDHDSLAPLVRITSTPSYINLANRSAFSVGGLCDEVSAVVTLTVSNTSNVVVASATANCDGDGFNSSIDLSSIVDGSYTLKSTLSDALSNEASYSKAVTADTTAPTLSISSASDLTSIAKNLSVSGLWLKFFNDLLFRGILKNC